MRLRERRHHLHERGLRLCDGHAFVRHVKGVRQVQRRLFRRLRQLDRWLA